ncbi:MAG TPA: YggS family pyridoxal phosphate-dependent enzyme [Mycobacteriales bacterium]|nr:YggS family pyridoxal phosphate-dependent enzyme [Mycobacteriales bacterium]
MAAESPESRSAELAANLADVRRRIDAACAAAGRSADELTLIGVTKTFPASDIRRLAELGVTDIGENRDQEAAPKHAACADLPLRWHFVGRLQRNKCRSVAGYADVVHSVDRLPLVTALSEAARRAGRTVTALVQVSLDPRGGATGRSGVAIPDAPALADAIAAAPALALGGVMAVAPLGGDPAPAFAALAEVAAGLRSGHPQATVISAGMTGDFETAVQHGATHLRIGTALLGRRDAPVG